MVYWRQLWNCELRRREEKVGKASIKAEVRHNIVQHVVFCRYVRFQLGASCQFTSFNTNRSGWIDCGCGNREIRKYGEDSHRCNYWFFYKVCLCNYRSVNTSRGGIGILFCKKLCYKYRY